MINIVTWNCNCVCLHKLSGTFKILCPTVLMMTLVTFINANHKYSPVGQSPRLWTFSAVLTLILNVIWCWANT